MVPFKMLYIFLSSDSSLFISCMSKTPTFISNLFHYVPNVQLQFFIFQLIQSLGSDSVDDSRAYFKKYTQFLSMHIGRTIFLQDFKKKKENSTHLKEPVLLISSFSFQL